MTQSTPKRESTKRHWETFWTAKKEVREVYSNGDRVLRNLLKVTDLTGKSVLEIGAGTGRDSFEMLDHGAKIYLLDYAESSLQIIRQITIDEKLNVGVIRGDGFRLPFPDGSFDVVFHQGLLEHFRVKQADQLLQENIRVLKQGGLLLVDVPQRFHPYTIMKHILIALNKWFAGWEREFSVGELEQVLRQNNVVPEFRYGEWMYPCLGYRVMREALLKFGLKLPLYPKLSRATASVRARIRERLSTSLALHTGFCIGVIARKP